MLKQVFPLPFEPMLRCFGRWKIPKCLSMGCFGDQKRVNIGHKNHFSKSDGEPFGMLEQVFFARFQPMVTRFGPLKIP